MKKLKKKRKKRKEPSKFTQDLTARMTQKGLKGLIPIKVPPKYANT